MITMDSKYDNVHKNEIFYALICINNYVIASISCMLSVPQYMPWIVIHRSQKGKGTKCIVNMIVRKKIEIGCWVHEKLPFREAMPR